MMPRSAKGNIKLSRRSFDSKKTNILIIGQFFSETEELINLSGLFNFEAVAKLRIVSTESS